MHTLSLALSLSPSLFLLTFYLTSSICTICSSIFHVLHLVKVSVKQKNDNSSSISNTPCLCILVLCCFSPLTRIRLLVPPLPLHRRWQYHHEQQLQRRQHRWWWTMVMVATSSQQQLNKYRSVYVIELRVVYFWCAKLEIHLGLVRNSVGELKRRTSYRATQ